MFYMKSKLVSRLVLCLSLVAILSVCASAQGKKTQTFPVAAAHFDDQGYKLNFVMPPNWDGSTDTVQIFGYYGEDGKFQDVVVPVSIEEFGLNLLIEFPESVKAHANGMPLHHIDVEVKVSGQRPAKGFGFGQMTK